ncbi:NADH-quinone oxidoreductase subunit N [Halomonas campisalis]|uniref:NADH-quinone oxidoreductase subunit N n=1 Tax=Billgrantia campisalis TaxID=74661 RepID=A0ABS9PDN1_9GAMM|nr:proton-conducting transporter membrane subunit [Halomonas campisalis]MCG6659868.1 NADH-quinone oxidoreductase subunit N [Halomonas campisalis]MDR5865055.1 proton-conducting transporter membrane subunit [Halomonas campisalis]
MIETLTAWSLPLLVVLPLGLALAAFFGLGSPRRQVMVGLAAIGIALAAAALSLLPQSIGTIAVGGWQPPVGILWRLDVSGALMLGMTALVAGAGSLALLHDPEIQRDRYLWSLWWLLWGGLNALLLSRDLFNLYVTLELVALAAVGLVALSRYDPQGRAALRYLLASLLASLLYLLGVALLYGQTARLDMTLLAEQLDDGGATRLAAVAISLGLLIKAAMVPLHAWLPAAHARARPPVSAMLSATVVAAALFILWRLWLGPFAALRLPLRELLTLLGSAALIWGGLQALLQTRLKLMIAWSTLSQSGYALLLLGLAGSQGWPGSGSTENMATAGALLMLLAHGLAKAALFLAAGAIATAHGHDRLAGLTGSATPLPLAWLAVALAGISLVGIPPTGGFVGKWWLLQAAIAEGRPMIGLSLLLGTLLTAAWLCRLLDLALRPVCAAPASLPRLSPRGEPSQLIARLTQLALGLALLAWLLGPAALLAAGGIRLALPWPDPLGLAFLLPALAIWPLAIGVAARWRAHFPAPDRLLRLLLAAALAHALTLLAQDLLTFYIGVALLSLLGWALVQHHGTPHARRAGAGYLTMMLLAEVAMLAGLALVATTGTDLRFTALAADGMPPLALACLAAGLAIKAGVIGVHAWLPPAHPVAPPMASAVLSGLMIKAGVLGALRLLPEAAGVADWGLPLVTVGLLAALYGALRGLPQDRPKSLLAWSSVSQMGLITALLGLVLLESPHADALSVLLLLVTVHALAKAALFLGTGMLPRTSGTNRRWVLLGMLLPALTLAGVPLTGGIWIKAGMETALDGSDLPSWPITLSGIATGLLMLRLFWLLQRQPTSDANSPALPRGLWLGWWGLGIAAALLPWGWQAAAPMTAHPGDAVLKGMLAPLTALALAGMALPAHRLHARIALHRDAWRRRSERHAHRQARQLRTLGWQLRRADAWLLPWPAFGISLGLLALAMGLASLVPG